MCGVVQGGNSPGLALKPLLEIGISRDMFRQHLDGNRAVQAGVGGLVNLAHAPSAKGGVDLVRAERGAGLEWHGSGHEDALGAGLAEGDVCLLRSGRGRPARDEPRPEWVNLTVPDIP